MVGDEALGLRDPLLETGQRHAALLEAEVHGPGDVEVPKIVGLSLKKAKTDVEKLGLKAAVRWVSLAETDTYVVLSQKPAAGQKLKPGSDVQMTVNR